MCSYKYQWPAYSFSQESSGKKQTFFLVNVDPNPVFWDLARCCLAHNAELNPAAAAREAAGKEIKATKLGTRESLGRDCDALRAAMDLERGLVGTDFSALAELCR